jgi:hypothetical protein
MQGKDDPIPELGGRTWAELEVIDGESGHVLFRDQIRQRTKEGWKAIDIRVRVTRPEDSLRARSDARVWFAALKLDPDRDQDMLAEIEQICLLSLAIRTAKPPHAQLATHEELARDFDEGSLQDVLGRINVYKHLLDPREPELDADTVFRKVVAVAEVGHLGPLTDIAGHEQPSFLLRMARLACDSPTVQSWLQSRESSMPGPSPRPRPEPS